MSLVWQSVFPESRIKSGGRSAAGYVIKYKKQLQRSRIHVIIYHKGFSAI